MQVNISDAVYGVIASREADVSAFVEQAARRALGMPDEKPPATLEPAERGKRLVEEFREFRGMLKETTVEEIVETRHEGLS